MVGAEGFEPHTKISQDVEEQRLCGRGNARCPHIGPQYFGVSCPRLTLLIEKWEELPDPMKRAIMAIVESS